MRRLHDRTYSIRQLCYTMRLVPPQIASMYSYASERSISFTSAHPAPMTEFRDESTCFDIKPSPLGATLLAIQEQCLLVGLLAFPLSAQVIASAWLSLSSSVNDLEEHRHSQLAFRKDSPFDTNRATAPTASTEHLSWVRYLWPS
jgi:hypothetical protein